ncbi:MAG: capsular biosynthesis protein [Candidatus Saccharibacteria bacterium]|nr:capsular biosynthesis protein [Candidatus Saccharibacteria bacterium]
MYDRFGKRSLDIVMALGALAVFSVPMIVVALWVKLDSKGPVFFKQLRSGKNQVPFLVYKFRTMSTDAPKDAPTKEFKDAGSYITRSGKILRKLSLDELPQLFNVIKGDMSVVGPRPVVLKELNLLNLRQPLGANSVKPGITGWAQVNGRDELNDIIKARMDGEYVSDYGFTMDIKCLRHTVWAVLSVKGNQEGHELNSSVLTVFDGQQKESAQ